MKRAPLILVGLWSLAGLPGVASAQTDKLPDIITDPNTLYDWDIITSGGTRLLRLANATPNRGIGRLHLYGGAVVGSQQQVWQRIFRTDGTFWDRMAGTFTYHAGHGHIHYDNWCKYRLREVTAGGGVGAVLREGAKVSFCILDLSIYDPSIPGYVNPPYYGGCGSTTQGLTPGWKDIYGKTLAGQNIDITGIPDGTYWLESEVDPDNSVIESDETNNISRIQISIGGSTVILPDPWEPNDSRAITEGRPVGAPNSPHLGPCFPLTTLNNTTIHSAGNDDYYRFYLAGTGVSGDKVRIEFTHGLGDIDMSLQNASGSVLASSTGTTNAEEISLSGRGKGWYFLRVYGFSGATSPNVKVIIDPPASAAAPNVTVTAPPAGITRRYHALENYTVTWTSSDPDGDPTWVTIYANTTPSLNGSEILIADTINTPGTVGSAPINSAYLSVGTWYFYARITDGGSSVGAWSPGAVEFIPQCIADRNLDYEVDFSDIEMFLAQYAAGSMLADINGDGEIDFSDIEAFIAA